MSAALPPRPPDPGRLRVGARLGTYEIVAPLGAGGMGEVFRARDTKLGREVALKGLPSAFAEDAERLARFEREARLLAALNHPTIAQVYGFESATLGDGSIAHFLAMELVPGEDLAERLKHGKIPVDESIAIARQVAEALEEAHEKGIVHRDLKPANIKVTPDGKVKVLDFGLAKAWTGEATTGTSSADSSQSPTLAQTGTAAGLILGTAAYMSPEQAKGKPADRRADIWSFGVVLYEMLSGKRMWSGETPAETLASVLKTEPDWGALPAGTSASLRRLLRRCLEKDARRRLQAIGEARIAIEDALGGVREETAAERPSWRRTLPWALASALALASVLVLWAPWRPAPQQPMPLRLSVELGTADVSLAISGIEAGAGPAAILSPDGAALVFTARKAAREAPQLYVRRLDQLQATALAGTDGAANPFFSPDGQWIGFFADGKLKKIAIAGGAPVTLCDAPLPRGGSWAEDGTILLGQTRGGLARVPSAGGSPRPLTSLDTEAGETTHRWPQALLGGKAVLFTASRIAEFEEAHVMAQRLPDGPRKVVQRGGYHGRYLASGHVVYMREGTLFAVPFDLERLEPTGEPVPVLEGVRSQPLDAGAQLAFSARGTFAFVPGPGGGLNVPIQWMDRQGKTQPLRDVPALYGSPRFSPDGRLLAMDIRQGSQTDVWVYDRGRDTMSRLTSDASEDSSPVWTPDGRRIAFSSARGDKATRNLYWQRADGTGEAERLTESKNVQIPTSWHPTGRMLAYTETAPWTGQDIMILPLEGDEASGWKPGKATVFLNSPFVEHSAAFSPDGRWLAYTSNESGRGEVYVRPFPGPGGKWQVSTDGAYPTWSRNRRELFYWARTEALMVVAYAAEGDSFRAEKPRQWSPARVPARPTRIRTFDLHPDGQRFAVLRAADEQAAARLDHVVLIQNFFEELRRVAPPAKP